MTASHSTAISSLIEGYKRFKERCFEKERRYDALVKHGQRPKVLIIACSDSRVDPAILTDSQPGEIFVVRNVANLVPSFDPNAQHDAIAAALEYGVKVLKVSDIIVLGHSHCGGIEALMRSKADGDQSNCISRWIEIAQPTKETILKEHPDRPLEEQIICCEKASLLSSVKNLKTYPFVEEALSSNSLTLNAWYFDLSSGAIQTYDRDNQQFSFLK